MLDVDVDKAKSRLVGEREEKLAMDVCSLCTSRGWDSLSFTERLVLTRKLLCFLRHTFRALSIRLGIVDQRSGHCGPVSLVDFSTDNWLLLSTCSLVVFA